MSIESKIALAMSANGASFEQVHSNLEKITDEFAIEFAIFSKDYSYHNSHSVWVDSFNVLGERFTSQQLMVKFKNKK